jgi:hypothetical protein
MLLGYWIVLNIICDSHFIWKIKMADSDWNQDSLSLILMYFHIDNNGFVNQLYHKTQIICKKGETCKKKHKLIVELCYIYLAHLCELLTSLGVRRPSVNFFKNLLLWNHCANLNQTWPESSLGGSQASVCLFLNLGFDCQLEFRQYKFRNLSWFFCPKLNCIYCLNKALFSHSYVFSHW